MLLVSPSNVGVRLRVGIPLVVCHVALLNGGGSCLDWGRHSSHCPRPPRIVLLSLSLRVLPCLLWVEKCGGGLALLFCLCVRYHSIVDLVLYLCDRVVLLGNSGGGCGGIAVMVIGE